jgi:hypothetical protein
VALAPYKRIMLIQKMLSAIRVFLPDETPAFMSKGAAAKTAIIIPIKWVSALPGSRIVICIEKPPFITKLRDVVLKTILNIL